jgi:hypothetical protein
VPNNAEHIAGAVTGSVLVNTPGQTLVAVNINTGFTSVTLWDNTAASGSVIAVFGTVTGSFPFNIPLTKGLTITTVGAGDATFIFAAQTPLK